MAWSEAQARARVREFIQQSPRISGPLPDFTGGNLRARQRALREAAKVSSDAGPLDRLSASTALIVDGVHAYVQLLTFDDQLMEETRETERSHAQALSFLHFYYSMFDRIVDEGGGVRIDFHSGRMHFVVVEPVGRHSVLERINKALAITQALEDAAALAPASLRGTATRSPLRTGMDEGPCIAIANDRGHEMDPVFLGTPANLAAKLAAGAEPGVYLSPRLRAQLGLSPLHPSQHFSVVAAPSEIRSKLKSVSDPIAERTIFKWTQQARSGALPASMPNFSFVRVPPPLSAVRFADLTPSNSIRMEMGAIFADIDQFTAYVDRALREGNPAEVVQTMFVLREEQRAVLKVDFGAKRLRFIGDCVVGLIAEGSAAQTNPARTVEAAALCAAGLHNSMRVCRQEMPSAATLGLQVGIGYGPTPVTRLGLRGDMSVRCAASRAIIDAERHQGVAEAGETSFAPSALEASPRVNRVVETARNSTRAEYAALSAVFAAAPATLPPAPGPSLQNYRPPPAHSSGNS